MGERSPHGRNGFRSGPPAHGGRADGASRSLVWTGLRWAVGSWRLVGVVLLFNVVVSAVAALPGQAVILSALGNRPVGRLFGVGWHLEMAAELVIGRLHAFSAAAWLVGIAAVVYWVGAVLLWGAVARAFAMDKRTLPELMAGLFERGGRLLAVRVVGAVLFAVTLAVVWGVVSMTKESIFVVRVAVVVPAIVLAFLVHALVEYWWLDVVTRPSEKGWFVGAMRRAGGAVLGRMALGLWLHVGYWTIWAVLGGITLALVDPGRTWAWPIWLVVLFVQVLVASRLWLHVASLASEASLLHSLGRDEESDPAAFVKETVR